MDASPETALLRAILNVFETGLPQDAAVVHFIASTHGDLSATELTALLADRDDSQAASLVELVLFPGESVALTLEPALARARLDAAGVRPLADAVAGVAGRTVAVMPDGNRLPVALTPDDVRRFVARLEPGRNLPEEAARLLTERFGPAEALALAVTARQTGPDWSPAAASFFTSLLSRLDAKAPPAPDTIRFALRFLRSLPRNALPLPSLGARREQLATQLRRARQQEETLSGSNFETLSMTGMRLPYLHAPDIAKELALIDTVLVAVTGRLPDNTATRCRDMGTICDVDALMAAFLHDQAD
ncbi:MAG: hypothetical protein AB9872_05145 [Solidesulfovibrio sp.]